MRDGMADGGGMADLVSRDKICVQLTTSKIGNFTQLMHALL